MDVTTRCSKLRLRRTCESPMKRVHDSSLKEERDDMKWTR